MTNGLFYWSIDVDSRESDAASLPVEEHPFPCLKTSELARSSRP
jgi:hypothetical protein